LKIANCKFQIGRRAGYPNAPGLSFFHGVRLLSPTLFLTHGAASASLITWDMRRIFVIRKDLCAIF
jgi:hypothetical protein